MSGMDAQNRLISLDVFRGLTIAGMILVNNPGDWSAIYTPFSHASWHGLTPTDLIFPFFLFIVGVSIYFALGKRIKSKDKSNLYLKIFRRSLLIFILGLFLNAFPLFDFNTLRIPGVLQRIAICYLIVSLLFLHLNWKQQTVLCVLLLLSYWILLTSVNVPGCVTTSINDKACNLSAYLDRLILGENHIWSLGKVYDPEGILSTIPAIVTTICGLICGIWLKSDRNISEKVNGIFFFGLVLLAGGWAWSFWFPLNKALWTSSYVLVTAGAALCFLGSCLWLIDLQEYKRWSKPFVVFGTNALALYIGAELTSRILDVVKVAGGSEELVSVKSWIYRSIFAPFGSTANTSLAYAISFLVLWYFLMWVLYRKRIFIKV